jgi:hypothetical protein
MKVDNPVCKKKKKEKKEKKISLSNTIGVYCFMLKYILIA